MNITHKITRAYADRGETVNSNPNPEAPTGNSERFFDETITGVQTDDHRDFVLKRGELISMSLTADQNCTIGTNGTAFSSPPTCTDRIDLIGGCEYVWTLAQDGLTPGPAKVSCPITADITTGIYITSTVSPPASVRLRSRR